MEEHRMKILVVHVTQDDLQCMSTRSDGQMLTLQLTHYIRFKQMIMTANFHGMGNLPVKLQFIYCGSDQFVKHFDVSEGQQLRDEQKSDKLLIIITVDSTQMKFALA
ncbi:MAG: hypothetical protein EZS28_041780 [Streblomastix strix]|uniref:Uncharacterized protein n=1 Tax=Streblomastix strix TaxID=222440 RepID=A0A5J4TXQ8_9EUKA|nr:MAG: hypothetical protein EZS28_041780 [Streblomastix strix]